MHLIIHFTNKCSHSALLLLLEPSSFPTNCTLEVSFHHLCCSLKKSQVNLAEILYHSSFLICCNVVVMSPSCSCPPFSLPPLGEKPRRSIWPPALPLSRRWTLGFSVELQMRTDPTSAPPLSFAKPLAPSPRLKCSPQLFICHE